MKRLLTIGLLLALFVCCGAGTARAGTFFFGTQQNIHKIQDISIPGPKGEKLFIGNLVETTFFGLGVFLKDSGYVLGVDGQEGYYPFPEGAKLELAQQDGVIPNPLPPYKISLFEYALGYSLWLALAGLAIWAGAKKAFRR